MIASFYALSNIYVNRKLASQKTFHTYSSVHENKLKVEVSGAKTPHNNKWISTQTNSGASRNDFQWLLTACHRWRLQSLTCI